MLNSICQSHCFTEPVLPLVYKTVNHAFTVKLLLSKLTRCFTVGKVNNSILTAVFYCECHCVLLLIKSYKWPIYEMISVSFRFPCNRYQHSIELTVFTLRKLLLQRTLSAAIQFRAGAILRVGVGDQRIERPWIQGYFSQVLYRPCMKIQAVEQFLPAQVRINKYYVIYKRHHL